MNPFFRFLLSLWGWITLKNCFDNENSRYLTAAKLREDIDSLNDRLSRIEVKVDSLQIQLIPILYPDGDMPQEVELEERSVGEQSPDEDSFEFTERNSSDEEMLQPVSESRCTYVYNYRTRRYQRNERCRNIIVGNNEYCFEHRVVNGEKSHKRGTKGCSKTDKN